MGRRMGRPSKALYRGCIVTRREFPRSVKVAAVKRARNEHGELICEGCGCLIKGGIQIDHRIADAHGGEPVLENAQVLGACCYMPKNTKDTIIAAKLKRIEAVHLGAVKPEGKIQSRGFAPGKNKRTPKQSLPPLGIYGD